MQTAPDPPGETLPIPPFYDPHQVEAIRRVPYAERAAQAEAWRKQYALRPAADDPLTICLLLVDMQNTFCTPGFELYVGGPSGRGAVEDSDRLCRFLYRNLQHVTRIVATLDTHQAMQIFHPSFLVDEAGHPPAPMTPVTLDDVRSGRWSFRKAIAPSLGITAEQGQTHLEHYVASLSRAGRYTLRVWPYHAMLGGIGHALVPAVEEAVFFHGQARLSQPHLCFKGRHPLTEHYSVFGPEVRIDAAGNPLVSGGTDILKHLHGVDVLLVAGQAKSHCVAWTLEDLQVHWQAEDPARLSTVYLLEDCTSPVTVPDGYDFSEEADAAFTRFAQAGMHRVSSTTPMQEWPGMPPLPG